MNTNNIIEVDMSTKKREIHTSAYYQYDRGLMIRLINVPECNDFSLSIEMCNDGDGAVKHTIAYSGEDVEIPADLLLNGRKVRIFIFAIGEGRGRTILTIDAMITLRPSR